MNLGVQKISLGAQWKILTDAAEEDSPITLEELPWRLGVGLKRARLDDGISGRLERFGDTFFITINALDRDDQQRLTLARGLGHYMLHRRLVRDGVELDGTGASTGKCRRTCIGPREKEEADTFADNLIWYTTRSKIDPAEFQKQSKNYTKILLR